LLQHRKCAASVAHRLFAAWLMIMCKMLIKWQGCLTRAVIPHVMSF
jgi:hypothetical protein